MIRDLLALVGIYSIGYAIYATGKDAGKREKSKEKEDSKKTKSEKA